MIVTGGIYSEICVAPPSHSLFGSGGRAALALTGLMPSVDLHAFQPARLADEVFPNFEPFGVAVHLYPCADRIHFHYLHPLARPRISPIPLPAAGTVEIEGARVLRFGCLEGDFKTVAGMAVYDPQTAVAPAAFRANGSTAERLAIVLNRAELRAATGLSEMSAAVSHLREVEGAEIVVVKAGPDGAYVHNDEGLVGHVPAYEASAIYKVGSGDTFSAAFAFYWMQADKSAVEAVQLASLHTAEYVESRRALFSADPAMRRPQTRSAEVSALVALGREGASARWLLDEAVSGLWDLGVVTRVHLGTIADAASDLRENEVLLLLDPGPSLVTVTGMASHRGRRIIAYCEASRGTNDETERSIVQVENELAAALYAVAWAS